METFELRYFLAVAKTQNIHNASKLLNITPSAISKAITRLEMELEVQLFERIGRNIQITSAGKNLMMDATEMLAIEKRIIESYNTERDSISIRIVGPELPLTKWGPSILRKIQSKFKNAKFHIEPVSNEEALDMIQDYSADLAIFSSTTQLSGKMFKKLNEVDFKVFTSKKHPLTSSHGSIAVEDILTERFAITDSRFYGAKSSNHSSDGWREDKFRRDDTISTNSLKCLESLILEGLAIAYLPEYYGNSLGLKALDISDCPYNCRQQIYLGRSKHSLDSLWSII